MSDMSNIVLTFTSMIIPKTLICLILPINNILANEYYYNNALVYFLMHM